MKRLFSLFVFPMLAVALLAAEPKYRKIVVSDKFHSEGAACGDFNNDGVMDVVSGHLWYEGPDFAKKHAIYEGADFDPEKYSNSFVNHAYDFNNDGWTDVLICPHPGTTGYWYENPKGKEAYWLKHEVSIEVGNESQEFVDINGDGRPELLFNRNGFFGFAAFDPSKPYEPWRFTSVSPEDKKYFRYYHGIGHGDINGDGRIDMLEKEGWYEQPAETGKTPWTFHPFKFADAASNILVYDVDGDGLNDVLTTRHCHEYGFSWFKQIRKPDGTITFEENVVMPKEPGDDFFPKVSQLHSMMLVDLDGDGLPEILTGKRFWAHGSKKDAAPNDPAILFYWKIKRGAGKVVLEPHVIDSDSGVGTQVNTGDLNKDGVPDIIIGNKKGTFVFLSLP